ncbi:MAG: tetratricopeptide repeat protein [Bacteroidales bacterium]|nr:tetratricopeptide repeat protein [Bacteroidales bacterium]
MKQLIKKTIFPFLILLIFTQNVFSQSEIDSLKNLLKTTDSIADIYYQIAYVIHYQNYDSCIYYCQKSLENTKVDDIENLTYVSLLLGVTYKNTGKYDSALFYIKQAQNYFRQDEYMEGVASCDNNIARIYQEIGDYEKSLSYYFESMQIFESTLDTINLANVYSNIGELYLEINNFDKALHFFNISKEFYEKTGQKRGEAFVLTDMASLYFKQKDYEQAKNTYKKSAILWEEDNRKTDAGNSYINLAEALFKLGENKEALFYFSKAYKLFSETDYTFGIVQALIGIGDYYFLTDKFNLAQNYYYSALDNIIKVNSFKLQLDIYTKLYTTYKSINYADSALKYLEKSQTIKDSIFNLEQTKNINNLQVKYDLKDKENQIKDLQNTAKIKQLEIDKKTALAEKRSIFLIFVILTAFVLALFAIVFFYQFRIKTKLSKELLLRVTEREVLLKELHHRVKNNLQIISSLLNLQKSHSKDLPVEEILEISRNRISSMVAIHEKLYKSVNLKSIDIAEYVEEMALNIIKSLNKTDKRINLNLEIENVFFEVNNAVTFGLILNELITNSIKHAFSKQNTPEISIFGKNDNNYSTIIYSDNGSGLTSDFDIIKTNSLGMNLITGMTKQIKGSFSIEETEIGVKFKIVIPLKS